jgi:hypothetical protein
MNVKTGVYKLDERTRAFMIKEITLAVQSGNIFFSNHLTPVGLIGWIHWLTEAALFHDAQWLENKLVTTGACTPKNNGSDPCDSAPAGIAYETCLAHTQFNRFYMAAVCRQAIDDGISDILIRHGMPQGKTTISFRNRNCLKRNAGILLEDLRSNKTALKCDFLFPDSTVMIDFPHISFNTPILNTIPHEQSV